jgi:hypothetical protein
MRRPNPQGSVLLILASVVVTMVVRTTTAPLGEEQHNPDRSGDVASTTDRGGDVASTSKPVVYMADSRMLSDVELGAITSIDTAPWNVISTGAYVSVSFICMRRGEMRGLLSSAPDCSALARHSIAASHTSHDDLTLTHN